MLIFVVQCEYKSILHFRALEKKKFILVTD